LIRVPDPSSPLMLTAANSPLLKVKVSAFIGFMKFNRRKILR
jgi:hypothetical protein